MICKDLYIVGLKKLDNSGFFAIYKDKLLSYEQAKKVLKKLHSNNLDYKLYKVIELVEVD